jgi:hypothetical protein
MSSPLAPANIGLERDRRIEAPAAGRLGPDQSGDRLRPLTRATVRRFNSWLSRLGLAGLFHGDEPRMDLLEEIALDQREDRALLAIVTCLPQGSQMRGERQEERRASQDRPPAADNLAAAGKAHFAVAAVEAARMVAADIVSSRAG